MGPLQVISNNTIKASSEADCFVPAGLSYDTNRDLMVDLKQRQVEKRLVEDEPGHPITKSNSEVDLPAAVEGANDLLNLQSEGLEAPTEGVTVTTIKRAKSLSEVERKEFFPRPPIVSWIEDTDEWDGKSMWKALKNNPEMHSKLITSSS